MACSTRTPHPVESPFDHHIYCLASDGDIEEGVSSEASSLAGTQRLGNLTLIYDSNQISIEDDTNIALSEDTAARYAAYGWHVQTVDWTNGDTSYVENVAASPTRSMPPGRSTDQPSFIQLRTIIGWPAPNLQNTGKAHGAALGDDEVAATKKVLGFDPDQTFEVTDEVIAHTRKLRDRGQQAQDEWQRAFDGWAEANPDGKTLYDQMVSDELSPGWDADLPSWEPDAKGIATRAASGKVINALTPKMPELWGGSADLAESNNTTPEGEPSFLPLDRQSKMFPGHPYGRVLHFGIREHAMGAIMNGIKVHGGTRPYGGTFLTFSDYMRPAVRLSALMRLPVIYVWTHDSIGLGEDGPTHQPIEHLAALRAIPGLDVVRPADANEAAACWVEVLRRKDRPAGLILTRQALPIVPRGAGRFRRHLRRGQGGVRAVRGLGRSRGDPGRNRLGGAVRGRGAAAAGRRGHLRPRGVDAVPRVVRRAGPGLPRLGDPTFGQGPGERRGRSRPGLAGHRRRRGPDRRASTTTARARREPSSSTSSASAARRSPRRPGKAWPPSARPLRRPIPQQRDPRPRRTWRANPGVTIS